jgi:hypothetical protein
MDQIPALTANNLLVQGVGRTALLIKILGEIRGFIDEKVEYLAASATANLQKETLWRLHRGTSTKEFFCESFEHIIPSSGAWIPQSLCQPIHPKTHTS